MRYRALLLSMLLLAVSAGAAVAQTKTDPKQTALDKKDTRVEPTSWGNAEGRVYDAVTGEPIVGADVVAQNEGEFADKGNTVCKTNDLGGYKVRAVLGRISHNFDIGRALLSSPLGMLLGSATNTTKRIDVSRLNLRVTASGYKSFQCVVKAAQQDPKAFKITMEPILLVREGGEGVSTTAAGWGAVRMRAVKIEPDIVKPGDKVKLRAWVGAFGKNPQKTVEVCAYSALWKGGKKLKFVERPADGDSLFETEYSIGRREKTRVEVVRFGITKSVLDYKPAEMAAPAVLQVVTADADRADAEARREAITDLLAERRAPAAERFGQIAASGRATLFDYRLRGSLCEATSDFDGSVSARKEAVLRQEKPDPTDVELLSRSLKMSGRSSEIPSVVEPFLAKYKQKEWPRSIPSAVVGYLGTAYVDLGRIDKANEINERLLDWPVAGLDETVIEFRNSLRISEAKQALKTSPEGASALSEYGRALMDMGRYEEAIETLQKALQADPNSTAVRRDLTWAAIHLDSTATEVSLDQAISEAEEELNLGKGKQRSKDFFAWEQYALLLYAMADEQRSAGDPASAETLDKSIGALREALSLGRKGARRNAGHYSYFYGQYLSGSEVAIAGFAYPQANSCFVLLESLKQLRKTPNEPLALYGLAASLIELGQPKLAGDAIDRLDETTPGFVESGFLKALIAMSRDDLQEAKTLLQGVVSQNPRHPKASLLLADVQAKEGDVAASAEALALHAKCYGGKVALR